MSSIYSEFFPNSNFGYAGQTCTIGAPYNIGFETWSNGAIHTTYDNMMIYNINNTQPSNQTGGGGTNSTNSTGPLVALWHFDEGNGTSTADSSGNGNIGTLQNGVAWTNDSVSGNALQFDGVDDIVTTIQTPSIFLTNNISMEAWVKRNSLTNGTIASSNGPFFLAVYDNKVHGGVYHNDGFGGNIWTEIDGTTNLQVGAWYKLKMAYDGNAVKVYVNDVEENSVPTTGQIPVVGNNIYIGWGLPGQNYYFNGIIDEVSIRGM